jgi:ribA/ribD-fused uncharacterized protein
MLRYRRRPMSLPLDRASLLASLSSGSTFEYRFFWGHSAPPGAVTDACFSQWWRSSFELDGGTYSSAEQWMMASKARLFGDEATLAQIMAAHEPEVVKKLGRRVAGFDDATWRASSFDLVTRGNIAKFGQDAALRSHMLSTGDEILVEASPHDTIWGIGLASSAPEARDPARWRGDNLLGFALVKARAALRAGGLGPAVRGRSALRFVLQPRGVHARCHDPTQARSDHHGLQRHLVSQGGPLVPG